MEERLAVAGEAHREAAAVARQLGAMLKLVDSAGALKAFRQAAECDPADFWTWIEIDRLEQIVGTLDGARKPLMRRYNGDAAWEESVVLAAHRLSRVRRQGEDGYASFNPEWEERHRAFHLTLIAACGSRWLIDFYAMLMDRNTRYRYLAFADGSEPRDVDAEHQAIHDAVLARDADRAVVAANLHLRKTTDSVVARESDLQGIARVA